MHKSEAAGWGGGGGDYLRHVGLPKIPDIVVFSINRIEKTSITSFRASRRLIRHDRPLRPSHGGRLASLHALRPPTPAVPLLSRFPTSRLCQTAEEPDHMGQLHNVRRTALADENEVQSYGVLKNYATIPISEIIDVGPGFTVMKYIEGVDLETAWSRLHLNQLNHIKLELQGYIRQFWLVPNPFPQYAICSLRNIILTPNLDSIARIIEWEYAGFIPDPKDMYIADIPIEEWNFLEWRIFLMESTNRLVNAVDEWENSFLYTIPRIQVYLELTYKIKCRFNI